MELGRLSMKHTYTNEQIYQCCLSYKEGTSVQALTKRNNVPRSTIYYWLKKYNDMPETDPNSYLHIKRNLHQEREHQKKLESQCKILQQVECSINSPLQVKLRELEKLYGQYNIRSLCDALQVNRGTFYNHIFRNKRENSSILIRRKSLGELIQIIYDENKGIYGARKIWETMKKQGYTVSLKMVKSLMQEMNLKSIRTLTKKQFLKNSREQGKINLVRETTAPNKPNEIWVGDITQFHFLEHKVFVLDLFSRKIIAYKISNSCTTQLVTSTLRNCI